MGRSVYLSRWKMSSYAQSIFIYALNGHWPAINNMVHHDVIRGCKQHFNSYNCSHQWCLLNRSSHKNSCYSFNGLTSNYTLEKLSQSRPLLLRDIGETPVAPRYRLQQKAEMQENENINSQSPSRYHPVIVTNS